MAFWLLRDNVLQLIEFVGLYLESTSQQARNTTAEYRDQRGSFEVQCI
jgi:hypothetical protein